MLRSKHSRFPIACQSRLSQSPRAALMAFLLAIVSQRCERDSTLTLIRDARVARNDDTVGASRFSTEERTLTSSRGSRSSRLRLLRHADDREAPNKQQKKERERGGKRRGEKRPVLSCILHEGNGFVNTVVVIENCSWKIRFE